VQILESNPGPTIVLSAGTLKDRETLAMLAVRGKADSGYALLVTQVSYEGLASEEGGPSSLFIVPAVKAPLVVGAELLADVDKFVRRIDQLRCFLERARRPSGWIRLVRACREGVRAGVSEYSRYARGGVVREHPGGIVLSRVGPPNPVPSPAPRPK